MLAVAQRRGPSILGVYRVMTSSLGLMMSKADGSAAQQRGQKYMPRLLEHVAKGELDRRSSRRIGFLSRTRRAATDVQAQGRTARPFRVRAVTDASCFTAIGRRVALGISQAPEGQTMNEMKVARGLGWFKHRPRPGRDRGRPEALPHARDGGPHLAHPGLLGLRDRFGHHHLLSGMARGPGCGRGSPETSSTSQRWPRPTGTTTRSRDNVAAAIASIVGITWVDYWPARSGSTSGRPHGSYRVHQQHVAHGPSRLTASGEFPAAHSVGAFGAAPRRGQTGPRPGRSTRQPAITQTPRTWTRESEERMRAICWHGKSDAPASTWYPSRNRGSARCDRADHLHLHLRLGPAPSTTAQHADDGGGSIVGM